MRMCNIEREMSGREKGNLFFCRTFHRCSFGVLNLRVVPPDAPRSEWIDGGLGTIEDIPTTIYNAILNGLIGNFEIS